ncbi:NADH-ubiquinone oxidoreductase [Niveomyces insectorum RCEF 264]|uniref:NADH-ubiquinone oxidoreductase n=1 Tax=Niveomyces insectorum RCEF 264 TaxID=1081102 RepID=A0A167WXN3_9HYPO|nr:NADH-ubiquinone oxidoreductase [Niveomyces insectorum RCEF 264]
MRATFRLLAGVKPGRYFEPGAQTGLAGVYTHSTPRSTLLYLYSKTLEKLQAVPPHAVYRQSVEATTKHRLAIVQSVQPAGYEEWRARAQKLLAAHPEQFGAVANTNVDGAATWRVESSGRTFVIQDVPAAVDPRLQEWDGERDEGPEREGVRTLEERADQALSATRAPLEETERVVWEDEPQLTAEQIEELEGKLGAGLIEEVIQVAEGEARLVDVMIKAKVWENLEEKPSEGQWTYFERKP